MAQTVPAAERWQEFTFSGTDLSIGSTQLVSVEGGEKAVNGSPALGDQYLIVAVAHSDAAATASVGIVIADYDDDAVGITLDGVAPGSGMGIFRADIMASTATTIRSNWDGAGGYYIGTGSFTSGGGVTFDLTGIGRGRDKVPRIYVVCTALSAGTIKVRIAVGRAV